MTTSLMQAQEVDVIRYTFFIGVNNGNDSLHGVAGIRFFNKTASTGITLDLYAVDAEGKGMFVDEVKDEKQEPLRFSQEKHKLTVHLTHAKKDTQQEISISYRGIPKDGFVISRNRYGERTFFSDNWPNRAHHWIPCNDRPDDKASVQFFVAAPPVYQVISNGRKREEKRLENGLKLTHWEEETPLPTKVMAVGIARFAIKNYNADSLAVPVSAWVYPPDESRGFRSYAVASSIADYFTKYIAPFPFTKLANIQSTTPFGGMENASCIFYHENTVNGGPDSEAIIAHEIAHQWFGNMATEKNFAHFWLSEGFATYLTRLYWAKKYGREEMVRLMKSDRVKIIRFARMSNAPIVDSTEDLMSLLNANSYEKAGWVLHMLRTEVGDSVFQKIIQTYYNRYKGSNAETDDFRQVAEQVSGKELRWFFDQWLYRPGVPKLVVKKVKDGDTLRLQIFQVGAVYRLPLSIRITGDNGIAIKEKLLLTEAETEIKWNGSANSDVKFLLDPDCELLFEEIKK